jgi:methionyl-tRNA synthetase
MGLSELQSDIKAIVSRIERPERVVVTGGMPYANGPLHIGHLAGAHVPPDVYARWMRMLIGAQNVLFVCGTDDHGSTSEVSARKQGREIREFIAELHAQQKNTLERYGISLDVYTGTSRPEVYPDHKEVCQNILRALYRNGVLEKRASQQWYDTDAKIFLPDRYVSGTCPKCGDTGAYSDQCDACGAQYEPMELQNPLSSVSGKTPTLRETEHWFLDIWNLIDQLKPWIESKQKSWRKKVYTEAIGQVAPCLVFSNSYEDQFNSLRTDLPSHKSRYAPGKRIAVQFESLRCLDEARTQLENQGIAVELLDGWAHRSITRDIAWGIPVPPELDESMTSKTLYVWPESLIAPIAFTRLALKNQGRDPDAYKDFWCNEKAKIAQFVGIDNIFFYVVMQGALWFGSQQDPKRAPVAGELQLTDVYSNCHLQINGEKMSKTKGNFFTGDQLIDECGFTPDQIRYYLSQLSLPKKESNFELAGLQEKADFLAGPMNSAFERTISACHSKFDSKVPSGNLIGKTEAETKKIIQAYMTKMSRAEYPDLLFLLENYARLINKLFANYKPHDDRHPEDERRDALFSSFFILKNLMIMLYPFVPATMEKLRGSLGLPSSVFAIEELGVPIEAGHVVGNIVEFFPGSVRQTGDIETGNVETGDIES